MFKLYCSFDSENSHTLNNNPRISVAMLTHKGNDEGAAID
jgi:hypothetical protein